MSNKILGFLLITVGIFLGFYLGGWICLVGGIVEVFNEIRAESPVPLKLAIGIAKIMCFGLVGVVSFWIFALPGIILMEK